MFTTAGYVIALCRLVDSLPNRTGKANEIISEFEKTYRSDIPGEHFGKDSSGAIMWVKKVQWCRQSALMLGWMDSPARGIWRLTRKGHEWIAANPDATHIPRLPTSTVPKESSFHSLEEKQIPKRINLVSPEVKVGNHYTHQQHLMIQQVSKITNFLDGRSNVRPSDEQLCDWVNFCYSFELYEEGHDLFRLVVGDGVNPWYLERTRKLAKICGLRARAD